MLSVVKSLVSLRLGSPALPPPGTSPARPRSYGRRRGWVQVLGWASALAAALLGGALASGSALPAVAAEGPLRIVALGDSLTAGFGLPASAAFPEKLERALTAKGLAVEISNAGVSGDTMSAGLAPLDSSGPEGTQTVIPELGAHRKLPWPHPQVTPHALHVISPRSG